MDVLIKIFEHPFVVTAVIWLVSGLIGGLLVLPYGRRRGWYAFPFSFAMVTVLPVYSLGGPLVLAAIIILWCAEKKTPEENT